MGIPSGEISALLDRVRVVRSLRDEIIQANLEQRDGLLVLFKRFYAELSALEQALLPVAGISISESDYDENAEELRLLQDLSIGARFDDVEAKRSTFAFSQLRSGFEQLRRRDLHELEPEEAMMVVLDSSTEEEKKLANEILSLNGDLELAALGDLAQEHYFPWFSEYDYIEGMMRAGVLVARIESLPEHLNGILLEIKQCYAFQRYIAVVALCRTSLEIAMRDLYDLNGFNETDSWQHRKAKEYFREKKGGSWKKYLYEYDPSLDDMMQLLCYLPEYERFEDRVRRLKAEMNRVIHGRALALNAERVVRQTLRLIHDLYAA